MLINPTVLTYHKKSLLFALLSAFGYYLFAYYTQRTDGLQLLLLYTLLFGFAYYLKKTAGFNTSTSLSTSFRFLVICAVLFRLLFLIAIPNLSQDFYRFVWDGRMILEGFNPYLTTPSYQIELGIISNFSNQIELYNGMGQLNASHYTNYPPINQLCFVIANLFPGQSILSSIVGLRVIIILADIGILYFGKKLLEALKLPSSRIWWYALNPFIIIELTGNLHFEGVMLFFLVWSLYLLYKGNWKLSAVIFACSISVKLIPLMFLPLFFWWFIRGNSKNQIPKGNHQESNNMNAVIARSKRRSNLVGYRLLSYARNDIFKLIGFYSIVIATTLLLFLPFFSMTFVDNYSQTVGLWFTNFEFNASIYYLAREIGYAITGYNQIAIIGKVLPLLSLGIILGFSFFKKNDTIPKLCASIVIVFSCYLFLSTTVHPWYLTTLVLLCVFTNYRFPLVWSFVIILSYLSYISIGNADKSENLWIVAVEYVIVFSVFIWEVILKKRLPVA